MTTCPCGEPATTTPDLCPDCWAERLMLSREYAQRRLRQELRRGIESHHELAELQFKDEETLDAHAP